MNSKAKSILSIVLCLVLTFTLGVFCVSADEITGNGTAAEPYIIDSADDLAALSEAVKNGNSYNGCVIALGGDIAVSGAFSPIGSAEAPFSGTFLGNGYTVSGITVNSAYAGFFGYTKDAEISGLTVKGTFDISGGDYAGAVAAYAENTIIIDCTGGASVYADNYAGGIAGYLASGCISDSKTLSSATVGSDNSYCGGIAGFAAGDITGCTNSAYIFANKNVGGIAGASKADIISCTNTIRIDAYDANYGGIAGITEGTIKFCKNTGTVSGTVRNAGKAGGIAGIANNAVITQCQQTGNVISAGEYAGGVAGYVTNSEISDCICTGNVTTTMNFAGGIFGSATKTDVARCLFTGTVTAADSTDGAIGAVSGASVSNCYYNCDTEAKAFVSAVSSDGATGITAAAASTKNSFEGWDFEDVWTINSLHSNYPILVNIPYHSIVNISTVAPTCTTDGLIVDTCSDCHEIIETVVSASGHNLIPVSYRNPSCTLEGYVDSICTVCSKTESEKFPATGHKDADKNEYCDTCNVHLTDEQDADKTIFEKIIDFFKNIIEWLKSLFS